MLIFGGYLMICISNVNFVREHLMIIRVQFEFNHVNSVYLNLCPVVVPFLDFHSDDLNNQHMCFNAMCFVV